MYIKLWDDFQRAAEDLYRRSPKNSRYLVNIRRVDGCLVLKVTDDKTCLKFKTDQASDLKKFERLNRNLMRSMQNQPAPAETTDTPVAGSSDILNAVGIPIAVPTNAPAGAPASAASVTSAPKDSKPKPAGKKKGGKGKRR